MTKRTLLTLGLLVLAGAGAAGLGVRLGWLRHIGAPGSPERVIDDRCHPLPKAERQNCYLTGLERRLADSGVAAAMATLAALARDDKTFEKEGHVYAHGVGIKGYLVTHNVQGTFDQCPTGFASGCSHGVIQAYLESRDSLTDEALNTLCQPYRGSGATQWQLFQCVHGTGHGLVMMYQGDLPHALVSCDRLTGGWDRDSCYGGAFMENIIRTTSPHHPASELAASHHHMQAFKALDSTDLLYPCSIVEDRYHRACYEIQTAAIFHFTKGKVEPAAAACDGAPAVMRPVCYTSLGRDISAKALRNPAKAVRLCEKTGETNRPWCFFGVAKALVDWDARPSAGLAFCQEVGNARGGPLCFRGVGEQVYALRASVPDRERECKAAGTAEAISSCRWGAMIPGVTGPATAAQP